jgi:hypothetical protein
MSTVDFNVPFNKSKIVFGPLKKLEQGGVINVKYNGNPIVIRTPCLKAPYGVSLPFSQRAGKGGASDAAPGKGDSNKCTIDVSIDTNEHAALYAWLCALQEACIAHIQSHGVQIFGSDGLNFKKGPLAEKLAELAAGTTKIYKMVKVSDDGYPPKIGIKFPNNSDAVTIVNSKNQRINHTDVGKGSTVTVLFGVSGLFVNGLMSTIQTQAQAICARSNAAIDTSKIFEDVLDEDAQDAASLTASPQAKRTKRDVEQQEDCV